MTSTTRVLTGLLAAVAAVSLLVGGIGIMNIMLVSVTERTREIGIRLAIGAEETQVLMQFLVEAVVLSLFGGLVGIALGLALSAGASATMRIPFVLSPGIIALAFSFSAAIGVGFGFLPCTAGRASRPDRGAASRMMRISRRPRAPRRGAVEDAADADSATNGRRLDADQHHDMRLRDTQAHAPFRPPRIARPRCRRRADPPDDARSARGARFRGRRAQGASARRPSRRGRLCHAFAERHAPAPRSTTSSASCCSSSPPAATTERAA